MFIPRKLYYVLIFPYGIYFMEYFFRCNGNFIIHMEKILHEIDSIWKNYYIIKFPWNKYYVGTNISSHTSIKMFFFCFFTYNFFLQKLENYSKIVCYLR